MACLLITVIIRPEAGRTIRKVREAVGQLAETEVRKLLKMLQESEDGQNAVMCQGEFSLSYAVIAGLQKAGVRVVSAVSERKTVVKIQDGASVKTSVFRFAGYREYCRV